MFILWLALLTAAIVSESQCASPDFSQPLTGSQYQAVIGQGFSTNYFKSISTSGNPAPKYRSQNIQDIYDKGFRNVRLRCRADLDLYQPPTNTNIYFNRFLRKLNEVVDRCLEVGVAPIISWIHHDAEADATDTHRQNYIDWWTIVANSLKSKSYHLSFNLFTEIGVDGCGMDCDDSLRENPRKYNNWTSSVIIKCNSSNR